MSDDLIKRLRFNSWMDTLFTEAADCIAALEAELAHCAPFMTDLMTDPAGLDAFMEANPLPASAGADDEPLDIDAVNRNLGIALLTDGQEIPVTNWMHNGEECFSDEASSCVCGPDSAGKWYSVNLTQFEKAVSQ